MRSRLNYVRPMQHAERDPEARLPALAPHWSAKHSPGWARNPPTSIRVFDDAVFCSKRSGRRCLPSSVLGPVLFEALRRLAAICLSEVIGKLLEK
jgi:hypothetical protein